MKKKQPSRKLSIITTTILLSFIFASSKKRKKIKDAFTKIASKINTETNINIKNWKSTLFNANNFNFENFFNSITSTLGKKRKISQQKIKEIAADLTDFFVHVEKTLLEALSDINKIKIFKSKSLAFEDKVKEWINGIKKFKLSFLTKIKNKAQLSSNPQFYEVVESILALEILEIFSQEEKKKKSISKKEIKVSITSK